MCFNKCLLFMDIFLVFELSTLREYLPTKQPDN